MLRYEIKRMVYSKKFFLVVAIGIAILLLSVFMEAKDYMFMDLNAPDLQTPEQKQGIMELIEQGLNKYTILSFALGFYSMVMPLLCGLAFSLTYNEDLSNGMIKNIHIRTSKKKYLFTKILINSIIGGLSVALPLLFIIILAHLFLKGNIYDFGAYGSYGGFLSDMFMNNTSLYYVIFLIIEFAFGAAYGNIALAVSTKIKSKIAILLSPYVFYIGISLLFNSINLSNWAPEAIPQFYVFPDVPLFIIVVQLLVIFLISSLLFLFWARKKKIYE